jgi:hypothetical protein
VARDATTHSIRHLFVAALAAGLLAAATANTARAAPAVTITAPHAGEVTNERVPSFEGAAEQLGGAVTVSIYAGLLPEGTPLQMPSTAVIEAGKWSLEALGPLADGTYTAQAVQAGVKSLPVTFTILTVAPHVTIDKLAPAAGDAEPSFSGTASDTTTVTVQIHAGRSTSEIVATATAVGTGGVWHSSPASPALPPGDYTAVAVQRSSLKGNPTGRSEPAAFEILPAPVPPSVATPSTTQAPASGVASLIQTGPPKAAGPSLLAPFPVVRVAGVAFANGMKLRLLSVQQAPPGALVQVRCRGRGCPRHGVRRTTVGGPHGVPAIVFRSFERFLRPGAVLEIFITKPGTLGKYTRLRVRRGQVPERIDLCLDAGGVKPIACPAA